MSALLIIGGIIAYLGFACLIGRFIGFGDMDRG